jgi:hypothetical protein
VGRAGSAAIELSLAQGRGNAAIARRLVISEKAESRFLMKRLVLITALALGLALPAMAQAARLPQPIYFWGNAAANISAPGQPVLNQRVIRPSLILLFADGSWDIDHLHWHGWGSSVAHATGISSASNGIPNQAQGKRILTPAQITLSNPGRFHGREVYRCFVLTDAHITRMTDHPDGAYNCLETVGGFSFFGPATPPASPNPLQRLEFFAGSPLGGIGCEMDDDPGIHLVGVICQSSTPNHSQTARLAANGRVQLCAERSVTTDKCDLGNAGENTPTFKVGKQVRVGLFRCRVLRTGVECTVIKSGKGFLMSKTRTMRVT